MEQGERLVWRWQSRLDHPTVNMGNLLLEESSRKFYSFAHNQPDHDLMTENDNLSKSNILRTKMLTLICWKGMCGILIELDDGWISPVSISVTDFDLWALLSHGWLVKDILLLLLWTFVHLNIASKWGSFPDYDDYDHSWWRWWREWWWRWWWWRRPSGIPGRKEGRQRPRQRLPDHVLADCGVLASQPSCPTLDAGDSKTTMIVAVMMITWTWIALSSNLLLMNWDWIG